MPNPDARARALADAFWERLLELEPLLATQVGDERYDDLLPDISKEGMEARRRVYSDALESARGVGREDLGVVERTTLDLLEEIAKRELSSSDHHLERFQAASHMWGPGQLLADLASLQRADTRERIDRYVARLRAVPRYLDSVCVILREAASSDERAPRLVVERSIGQVERLLAIPLDSSPSLAPLPESDAASRDRVLEVLRGTVMSAYEGYLSALREYLPAATETIGLHALPGGDEIYAAQILAWTTVELDAGEVHRLGAEHLRRIQEERGEIVAELGFPDAAAAVAALMGNGGGTARTREDVVRLAQTQVARGWEALQGFFGTLPQANCEVHSVEAFRERDMPMAFYQSPSDGGARPGIYYVNTGDLDERPTYSLAATTYHEANPGHHLQLTIEQEIPDRPPLRRFGGLMAGSAFVEGWGLYSERLADEMGLYLDGYERLGMLEAQAFRANRLIVDTGIHAFGWTRDRAIAQMEEGGLPHTDAVIEVDRYITMPAQALTYKIGQIEIERWRRDAEQRKGSSFSLSEFHDRLLSLGSLPLPALARELARD